MSHDAKHSIFLSAKKSSYGLHSYTREYISALLRDVEVYISNNDSMPAHALITSLEEADTHMLCGMYDSIGNLTNSLLVDLTNILVVCMGGYEQCNHKL